MWDSQKCGKASLVDALGVRDRWQSRAGLWGGLNLGTISAFAEQSSLLGVFNVRGFERRGWRAEGVGAGHPFHTIDSGPFFCTLFPMPPLWVGEDSSGGQTLLYSGRCWLPTPSRQPPFETSENGGGGVPGRGFPAIVGELGSFCEEICYGKGILPWRP